MSSFHPCATQSVLHAAAKAIILTDIRSRHSFAQNLPMAFYLIYGSILVILWPGDDLARHIVLISTPPLVHFALEMLASQISLKEARKLRYESI